MACAEKRKNGGELIWHNGGTGGYTSSMALDLEHNNGIIILSNASAFHPQMGVWTSCVLAW
jgi:hypothetical protein